MMRGTAPAGVLVIRNGAGGAPHRLRRGNGGRPDRGIGKRAAGTEMVEPGLAGGTTSGKGELAPPATPCLDSQIQKG